MKSYRVLASVLMALLMIGFASAQSLGDAARQNRNQKKPAAQKVFTNDDLASPAPLVPTSAKEEDASNPETQTRTGDQANVEKEQSAPNETADKKSAEKEQADEWKDKVTEQQTQIADLERELNLMEREHQVKVAVYYADAGYQLRDSKNWAEQENKYESDHSTKKKQLEDAKQKLDDMKEEARKAGVPMRALE